MAFMGVVANFPSEPSQKFPRAKSSVYGWVAYIWGVMVSSAAIVGLPSRLSRSPSGSPRKNAHGRIGGYFQAQIMGFFGGRGGGLAMVTTAKKRAEQMSYREL